MRSGSKKVNGVLGLVSRFKPSWLDESRTRLITFWLKLSQVSTLKYTGQSIMLDSRVHMTHFML